MPIWKSDEQQPVLRSELTSGVRMWIAMALPFLSVVRASSYKFEVRRWGRS